MNKFAAISIFVRVVEVGGFTAAAGKLNMSVSAVTKTIARLEDNLGVQLFFRNTRSLTVTDYGREYYLRCVKILADLEAAETLLHQDTESPRGKILALTPLSFGRVTILPALPAFYARYPEISLELHFRDSDRPLDMTAEGYDVAVRAGEIRDSQLVTRLLTRSPLVTVAAPSYLQRHGTPRIPEDLARHNCVIANPVQREWAYVDHDGTMMRVQVGGNLVAGSADAMREAAAAGIGLVQCTWWLVRKDLENGLVVPILSEFAPEGSPISVLYAANRHVPAKTRAFVDFLVSITRTS